MANRTTSKKSAEKKTEQSAGRPKQETQHGAGASAEFLSLQRAAGNRAVAGLLQPEHDQAPTDGGLPASVEHTLDRTGEPLDASTRAFMESRFDENFNQVRVHTDAQASESAQDVAADAYTVGEDIVFGPGRYAPEGRSGKVLLAHELSHVVQQRGASAREGSLNRPDDAFEQAADAQALAALKGDAQAPAAPPGAPPALQRADLEKELDEELKKWAEAKDPSPSLDPEDSDYGFTLQEYAYDITHEKDEESGLALGLKPKPTDKKKEAEWRKNLKKAHLLALKILAGGKKVEQKQARAGLIAQDLAKAGLIEEALDVAGRLKGKEEKKYIYAELVRHLAQAKLDQVKMITTFFAVEDKQSLDDHPVLKAMRDKSGAFSKALGTDKVKAVVEIIVANYPADQDLVELLSEILVFYPAFRTPFSDWLWGINKELLFKVVDSDYFVEPGYGGSAFADQAGDPVLLEMADMEWVYTVKQKYYVNFLVDLAKKHKLALDPPGDLTFASIRTWLEANTERIGEVLQKEYPNQPKEITAVYEHIADIFFFHVDRGDVTPDLAGHIGGLGAGAPNRMRLRADCDVLAIYATRLLASSGFTPVGYMAILPPDPLPGHAVALLERGGSYYIVNNKEVSEINAADKEEALKKLRDDALAVYDPLPDEYRVFYADAEAGGAMPAALRDTEEGTRRADLEP